MGVGVTVGVGDGVSDKVGVGVGVSDKVGVGVGVGDSSINVQYSMVSSIRPRPVTTKTLFALVLKSM